MSNLRPYKPGDEKQILNLFNNIFNQNRSMEHWNWKFKSNPAGKNIIVLGDDEGKLIAQCTLLTSEMKVSNNYCKGGQSIDAMVDINYRRQGYFENLSFLSYKLGKGESILFRYSFPNPNSLNGILKKLGGILVSEIPIYFRTNRVDRFASLIFKNKLLSKTISSPVHILLKIKNRRKYDIQKDYKLVNINSFGEEFDRFWDNYKEKFLSMTIRSSSFLNWRIANHPDFKYKTFALYKGDLRGYIIVKIEEKKVRNKYPLKVGNIIDLIALNEGEAKMLIYRAVEYLEGMGVDFTTAWMPNHLPYRNIFKKLGFIKSRGTIPFAVKDITEDKQLASHIYDEENWYLMPIETDTY